MCPRGWETPANSVFSVSGDRRFVVSVSFLDSCVQWLLSAEGCRRAALIVRQARLPIEADDVVQEAVLKLLEADRRKPGRFDGEEFASSIPKAYCTRVMRNLVVDVQRGRVDIPLDPFDERLRDLDEDEFVEDGRQESIDAAERGSDEARTLIEEIYLPPDILAAVLTLWALERDPEADTGDAPRPRNGAKPEEKMMLIAMWFAGRREFLAGAGEAATAGQRKARSRWAERVRAELDRIRDRMKHRRKRPEEDR